MIYWNTYFLYIFSYFSDERNSETESQTNEDSSDTQLSTSINIGSLNHTTIHGSTESIASKPSGKQHTNGGIDKVLSHNQSKQNVQQKITSSMLQKSFTSDNKAMLNAMLDSRPGTPKDIKDSSILINKGDLTPNPLKHKLPSSGSNNSSSLKKSNNKKARNRWIVKISRNT